MPQNDAYVSGETRFINKMPQVGVGLSAELLELELRKFKDAAEAPRYKDATPYGVSIIGLVVPAFRQYQIDETAWATGLAVTAVFMCGFFFNALLQGFRNRKRPTVNGVVTRLMK